MKQREIILTGDDSVTIVVPALQATYHSKYGAVQESKHVFLEAGLKPFIGLHNRLHILEVGFGTGLNALLSLQAATTYQQQVFYYAVEPHPLNAEEVEQLNFTTDETTKQLFQNMHQCGFNEDVLITSNFVFYKTKTLLQDALLPGNTFNLIYFDAFDPVVQPELWTENIFVKLFECLQHNGILVTYCSKGSVQRAMKAAGFTVEKLKGPPHKREIIRGRKIIL